MSLALASVYDAGILLQADTFILTENDHGLPIRGQAFDRIRLCRDESAAVLGVGSRWVQAEFGRWLDEQPIQPCDGEMAERWAAIQSFWYESRKREIGDPETSQKLSESSALVVSLQTPQSILVLRHDGVSQRSAGFAVIGSGAGNVCRDLLEIGPNAPLSVALAASQKAPQAGSSDLFTNGFRSYVLLHDNRFFDLQVSAQLLAEEHMEQYREAIVELFNEFS